MIVDDCTNMLTVTPCGCETCFTRVVCTRVGAAQLINKLDGEDFNEADEQLFEVRYISQSAVPP